MSRTKSGLEKSQGQRLHNFSVQSAPLLDFLWGQEVSTSIKVESILFQILAIISYPPPVFVSFQTLMFSLPPHKYLGAAIRPPKFPFSSSSLPRASAPSWNSLQFASVSYWPRDPKLDPWFQSHKGWGELQITPMDILACCSWCRPRCSCISLQPGHTADSQHPPGHLQAPASPSQQRCSKAAPPHQSGPSRYQLRDCSFPALTLGISLL